MKKISLSVMAVLSAFQSGSAFAESVSDLDQYQLNMRKGVTDISAEVYDLHMLMFIICVVIAVGVFGAMFYSILFHRKSRGAKPANFHDRNSFCYPHCYGYSCCEDLDCHGRCQ